MGLPHNYFYRLSSRLLTVEHVMSCHVMSCHHASQLLTMPPELFKIGQNPQTTAPCLLTHETRANLRRLEPLLALYLQNSLTIVRTLDQQSAQWYHGCNLYVGVDFLYLVDKSSHNLLIPKFRKLWRELLTYFHWFLLWLPFVSVNF